MLIVLSPAKTLDLESPVRQRKFTQPEFLAEAAQLVGQLKQLGPDRLSSLMNMSDKLGALNYDRYASWHTPFDRGNARPAIFTFTGDVYQGLRARDLSPADLKYAQQHLRILSGLYGVLRPLDLIQAYRLEMGTVLKNSRGKDLYAFWGDRITNAIRRDLAAETKPVLVNLASSEYFGALQPKALDATIVTPQFKDFSSGKYRFLSFFAKQARGMMAAWLVRNRVRSIARVRDFDVAGYRYSEAESTEAGPVFLRSQSARS